MIMLVDHLLSSACGYNHGAGARKVIGLTTESDGPELVLKACLP